MSGPPPKKPENRSRERDGAALTVLDGAKRVKAPKMPDNLLPAVAEAWTTFWTSPLAQQAIASDHIALRRLFGWYDERERYLVAAAGETLVRGSTGQMVINPLLKQVDALDAKILALEDRFGLSPMSRLRLQVTLGDASKSLADLNARLAAPIVAEDGADDPRVVPAAPVRKSATADRR